MQNIVEHMMNKRLLLARKLNINIVQGSIHPQTHTHTHTQVPLICVPAFITLVGRIKLENDMHPNDLC